MIPHGRRNLRKRRRGSAGSWETAAVRFIISAAHLCRDWKADVLASQFEASGYEYLGEFGIPGRRYLRKGGDERTHQIHIFEAENEREIRRHLAVRNYLRTHPDDAEDYGRLKKELAGRYPWDIVTGKTRL